MKRFIPELPRKAWIVLGGDMLSAVGTGMTLPFFVVYLQRVRGLDLRLATFALTTLALTSFAGNLLGGSLADRVGSRRALMLGLVLLSAGLAWFAFVHTAATAVGAAVVIGLGASIQWPAQDALLATVVEPEQRSAVFSVRNATLNAGLGVGALLAAAIVDFGSPGTFELLYLADAATCLAFLAVLLVMRGIGETIVGEERVTGGYRAVLRDRTFVAVWGLTALIVTLGFAQYLSSFSVYATSTGGIGSRALALVFAVNTFFVVFFQLVVLRLFDGRRRTTALVLACACLGLAWCLTIGAAHTGGGNAANVVGFAVAMAVLAAGETLLSPALSPIVNDLPPEALRGRYNGLFILAYTTGFAAGPLLAGQGLRIGDGTVFFVMLASGCGVAALCSVALRRRLDPRLDVIGAPPPETPLLEAEFT